MTEPTDPYEPLRTKDGKIAERPRLHIGSASLELDDYTPDQPLDAMVRISHRDTKHCAFLGDKVLLSFGGEFTDQMCLSGPLDVLQRLVDEASAKLAARQEELDRRAADLIELEATDG
jgi:hypothetical protein